MDQVGRYSLTSKKAATAMANALYKSSLILHNDDCMNNPGKSMMTKKTVCIDMAAGVGGNTIAFCKVKGFDTVIALEKHPQRAKMLRQNVLSQTGRKEQNDYNFDGGGYDDSNLVIVKHMDCLHALPKLQSQFSSPSQLEEKFLFPHNDTSAYCDHHAKEDVDGDMMTQTPTKDILTKERGTRKWHVVAFLDPPWGGIYYRQNQQRQQRCEQYENNDNADMGLGLICGDGDDDKCNEGDDVAKNETVPLSKAVALIAAHLAPLTLGIKVPLSFDIKAFVDKLENLPEFCCGCSNKDGNHHRSKMKDNIQRERGGGSFYPDDNGDDDCHYSPAHRLLSVTVLSVKKLHPQLFFILHLNINS